MSSSIVSPGEGRAMLRAASSGTACNGPLFNGALYMPRPPSPCAEVQSSCGTPPRPRWPPHAHAACSPRSRAAVGMPPRARQQHGRAWGAPAAPRGGGAAPARPAPPSPPGVRGLRPPSRAWAYMVTPCADVAARRRGARRGSEPAGGRFPDFKMNPRRCSPSRGLAARPPLGGAHQGADGRPSRDGRPWVACTPAGRVPRTHAEHAA